ncbi:MAG: hypothetical protein ACTS5P_02005 [Candidatus Hodgkinia cicadicola]
MRQFTLTAESGVGEEEGASAVEVVLAKVWNRERVVRPKVVRPFTPLSIDF